MEQHNMHAQQMDGMNMSAGDAGMNHDKGMKMDMSGGGGHQMMHMGNLKRKFWVSLIVTIPILLFSPMMGMSLPFQIAFPGSGWVVLVLATFLFFYGGWPFLSGAKMELQMKSPAMMTLISMGITVAYVYSLFAFISNNFLPSSGHKMDFFVSVSAIRHCIFLLPEIYCFKV